MQRDMAKRNGERQADCSKGAGEYSQSGPPETASKSVSAE
jgi:hypothetical protein